MIHCGKMVSMNYVDALVDEIALEGLDGITLQALWVRIKHRKNFNFFLDDKSKEFLWNVIKKMRNIELFILPKARPDLVLPNDDEDAETSLMSVQMQMKQLYPHCMVHSVIDIGSCSTYEVRRPVPVNILSLTAAECQNEWGGRLVLVASQQCRINALMGDSTHPCSDLPPNHYCVLERIGKARHYGILTFGPGGIQDMVKEDPRSHFYIRKKLLALDLITKQFQTRITKSGTNNCYVLHLTRFHVVIKSISMLREEQVISILKEMPEHYIPFDALKIKLGVFQGPFKKLMSALNRKGVIDNKSSVTYRTLHPNAKPSQWQHKSTGQEKSVRVVRLVHGIASDKNELAEDEPVVSEDEDDEVDDFNDGADRGFLDISKSTLDRSLTHQAYQAIESAGSEGLTQVNVGKVLGVGKLERRMVCKMLLKEGVVSVKMQDVGRQRVARYIAVNVQEKDPKFEEEKKKFIELVGNPNVLEKLFLRDVRNPTMFVRHLREEAEELVHNANPPAMAEEHFETITLAESVKSNLIFGNNEVMHCENIDDGTNQLETPDITTTTYSSHQTSLAEEETLLTYRALKRINIILAEVLKSKIVDDITKFHKLIQDEEREEGYDYKVDRRSLHRLIGKLQREKCLKLFKAIVKSDDKTKTLTFVCSPDIEKDHPSIQGAIEQAKFRIFNIPEVKSSDAEGSKSGTPLIQDSILLSMLEVQKLNKDANAAVHEKNSVHSNQYGYCPKFVRMRLLHKLFFYLTRCYEGNTVLDQQQVVRSLQSMGHNILPDDLPNVYKLNEQIDWKMFVPPLPQHEGWPKGWIILCDVVLRIPLSMFVRIMRVRYLIPGLDAYLSHPIKQHYLLGHLPRTIRNSLLAQRKFAFSLHETAQRLCFMGLLQFGPQRLKDKEQLFVYVNQNASILDTTPSEIGYFQVSTHIEYSKKSYFFSSITDLEKYWCDLYITAMCTQLGGKAGQEGKEIVLEVLENKTALLEVCQPRTAEEVELLDDGSIPGDHLGAGGLDSAFFAHLKRNWNSKYIDSNSSSQDLNSSSQTKKQQDLECERDVCSETITDKEKDEETGSNNNKGNETILLTDINVASTPQSNQKKKEINFFKTKRKLNRTVTRQLKKKQNRKKGRKQVKRSGTVTERSSWSAEEDFHLILFKVAVMFLCHESHKPNRSGDVIANTLQKYVTASKRKDGLQCLRRMNYLYNRCESAQLDLAMCMEECRQDQKIVEKFWSLQQNLKAQKMSSEMMEAEIDKGFEALVDILKQKYKSIPEETLLDTPIPDTLKEFYATYSLVDPLLSLRKRGEYKEPKSLEHIYFNTIISLIFLLNVYQQYPDKWLRSAISKLRSDQMVSSKKIFAKQLRSKNNQVPVTTTPFQFAMYYFHMMQSKYPYDVFLETWNAMNSLRGASSINLNELTDSGGRTALVFEGAAAGLVSIQVQMPAQIVMLDFDDNIPDDERKQLQELYDKIIVNTDKLDIIIDSEPTTAKRRRVESEHSDDDNDNDDDDDEPETKRTKLDQSDVDISSVPTTDNALTSSNQQETKQQCNTENMLMKTNTLEESTTQPLSQKDESISMREQRILEANVRARMKFYATRDKLKYSRSSDEGKDARARLAMNPCTLACTYIGEHLPLDEQKLKKIINSLKSCNVIKGECSEWSEVVQEYIKIGATDADINAAVQIVKIVENQEQLGITLSALRCAFSAIAGKINLAKHLLILRQKNVILRTGVTTVHFVHWSYKHPWLINSAKITRLERESLPPLNAVMLDLKENEEEIQESVMEIEPSTSEQSSIKPLDKKIMVTKKHEKSCGLMQSATTAEEFARQLKASCGEKVLVAIRPWVRVDGSLNRRVLDRLLGAVLCHLLSNPGCTLEKLQDRFCPALQPFYTFELLEILHMIEAVHVFAIHSEGTVTLFSKPRVTKIEPADFTESESNIFIDPAADAILRMTQFIGNKSYATDFLDDMRTRPLAEANSNVVEK